MVFLPCQYKNFLRLQMNLKILFTTLAIIYIMAFTEWPAL